MCDKRRNYFNGLYYIYCNKRLYAFARKARCKFMNKNDNDFWIAFAMGAAIGLIILILLRLIKG